MPSGLTRGMAGGDFRPADNVQFATDTKSTAIAAVSAGDIGSGMGKMAPMNATPASDMVNVRGGVWWTVVPRFKPVGMFVRFGDTERLVRNGVAVFASPVPKPRDAGRDRHAPQDDDGPDGPSGAGERARTKARKSTSSVQRPLNVPTLRRAIED